MAERTKRTARTERAERRGARGGERGHEARRAAIARLIRARPVGTQEELGALLRAEGFPVTQATLSRDLARLGARRAPRVGGGAAYELPGLPIAAGEEDLWRMGPMVTSVEPGDCLVVVHTLVGAAQAVALTVDRAQLSGVLGTVAGDDTLFVAPRKGVSPDRLSRRLMSLWKKEGF